MPTPIVAPDHPHDRDATRRTRPRPPPHRRAVGIALAVTLLTLAALVGFKVATRPEWRADTGDSLRQCLHQQSPADTSKRPPTAQHMADCMARRQPVRQDPIEFITVAALTALTAAEIFYLTQHR